MKHFAPFPKRVELVETIERRIRDGTCTRPLLVVGASGAGKSTTIDHLMDRSRIRAGTPDPLRSESRPPRGVNDPGFCGDLIDICSHGVSFAETALRIANQLGWYFSSEQWTFPARHWITSVHQLATDVGIRGILVDYISTPTEPLRRRNVVFARRIVSLAQQVSSRIVCFVYPEVIHFLETRPTLHDEFDITYLPPTEDGPVLRNWIRQLDQDILDRIDRLSIGGRGSPSLPSRLDDDEIVAMLLRLSEGNLGWIADLVRDARIAAKSRGDFYVAPVHLIEANAGYLRNIMQARRKGVIPLQTRRPRD